MVSPRRVLGGCVTVAAAVAIGDNMLGAADAGMSADLAAAVDEGANFIVAPAPPGAVADGGVARELYWHWHTPTRTPSHTRVV